MRRSIQRTKALQARNSTLRGNALTGLSQAVRTAIRGFNSTSPSSEGLSSPSSVAPRNTGLSEIPNAQKMTDNFRFIPSDPENRPGWICRQKVVMVEEIEYRDEIQCTTVYQESCFQSYKTVFKTEEVPTLQVPFELHG